jgi:hypothetical protein
MHTLIITLETWSDINDQLAVTHRHDTGAVFTTIGTHPDLGDVVIIQSIDGVARVSQLPLGANRN